MAFPDDYGRRCELQIPASPAALTDWTLVLTEDGLPTEIFTQADDGGGDIRFSADKAGATQLACDVRHFSSAGTADIAVKVPSTSVGATTSIWVWYNNPGDTQPAANDTYGQYNAYDANFAIVWPLNEDPGPGLTGDIKDRTSNQLHGTAAAGFTSGNLVNGQVHKAIQTTVVDQEVITSDSLVPTGVPGTIELVFKPNTTAGTLLFFISTPTAGLQSIQHSGGEFRNGYMWDEATGLSLTADKWSYGYQRWLAADVAIGLDKATYAYGRRPVGVGAGTLIIGQDVRFNNRMSDAVIDEIRVSTVDRGTVWLDYTHDNLMTMGTFVTVGDPEGTTGITTTVTATNTAGSDQEQFRWTEVDPP